MKLLLITPALALACAATAAVYQAEIWLYRVESEHCGGAAVEKWLASAPATALPLSTEEDLTAISFDNVSLPLPPQLQSVSGPYGAKAAPGIVAHMGPSLLVPDGRTGTVSFIDSTPIQYLEPKGGDEYKVVTLGTSPGTRLYLTISRKDDEHVQLRMRSEFSLIAERAPVEGADGMAVGEPQWAAGAFAPEFLAPLGQWVGALMPVTTGAAHQFLLPVVRIEALPEWEHVEYKDYDVNGDGIVEQVPFYELPPGAPLPSRPTYVLPPPTEAAPPATGYDLAQFPGYQLEARVVAYNGPLDVLQLKPYDRAWPIVGDAVAASWIGDRDLTDLSIKYVSHENGPVDADIELVSAPRVTSNYLMHAPTLFKLVLRNQTPAGQPSAAGSGVADMLSEIGQSHDNFVLPGHAVIADWATNGCGVSYDVHGWGPFKRSRELRADCGIMINSWVEPTSDPNIARVDFYFLSPYIAAHDEPPATEEGARALVKEREFRFVYECHYGETVCFINTVSPYDHYLVFATVERTENPTLAAFSDVPGLKGIQLPDAGPYGGGGTAAPGEGVTAESGSALKKIEVHGETRVRASWRSR